ncbi:MAG: hypothetical protein VKK97_10245, partial [Synechococcaceae cyanobacterium]|nr:hypothetical protein [Synechococcaceae cyanobacterium]
VDKVGREGIDTAAVAIDRLPQDIQPRWREVAGCKTIGRPDAPLELGLKDAYDLLADLGHPTGERWRKQRNQLIHALRIRNHSLFAHGFEPVGYGGWNELLGTLGDFLREAVDASIAASTAVPPVRTSMAQLPSTLAELLDEACSP